MRYGYSDRTREVQLVTLRLRATVEAAAEAPKPQRVEFTPPAPRPIDERTVTFAGVGMTAALYQREDLERGSRFPGPAIVVEYSSTTVVPPDWCGRIDEFGNLILTRNDEGADD